MKTEIDVSTSRSIDVAAVGEMSGCQFEKCDCVVRINNLLLAGVFRSRVMDLPILLTLRPDRALLNAKFDGYKLSLDPVPVLKANSSTSLHRTFTSDEQYSFLHARLFSLHNHLFRDPWTPNSGYFLDDSWALRNVRYRADSGTLDNPKSVFRFPKAAKLSDGYNVSCKFVSDKFCVFSDGCGALQILNTGDRARADEWKSIYREAALEGSTSFVLQDARLEDGEGSRSVHCLLLSIREKQTAAENEKKFEAVVDWVVLSKADDTNVWSKKHVRQLRCHSLPEYCALEPNNSNGLLLSAEEKFKFEFDVENPVQEEETSEPEPNDQKEGQGQGLQNGSSFTWSQSDEDISVYFSIEKESSAKEFKVVCAGSKINILHKSTSLLNSELYEAIDNDLTTWNLVILKIQFENSISTEYEHLTGERSAASDSSEERISFGLAESPPRR